MAGFEGSPVIAGSVVWAADTAGNLVALDLQSGAELWRTSLGAPVLSSLAVADGWLVVATYDGTVHAWSLPYGAAVTDPLEPATDGGGCCDAGSRGGGSSIVLALLVAVASRRRARYAR
jgi:outer membrane protein assembly factor BamB